MSERLVRDVMQHSLLTCQPTTPLDTVARRLCDSSSHALVVVDDDGHVVGIVTQTDLLMARYQVADSASAGRVAGDIMAHDVLNCTPETTLFAAVTAMTRSHVHRLVVVQPQAAQPYPVGMVTMNDIIHYLQRSPDR